MSVSSLKHFGRYLLVEPLAQGGMAEIHLAIQLSDGIGGRLIALKRMQNGHSSDPHFNSMFQSEARLAMRLNHPCIAQSYDFGDEEGQSFIAMEYVSGVSLTDILRVLNSQAQLMPSQFIFSIIAEVAGALHYAHGLADAVSGFPLGIVHRDISPQNVLVSYDGQVKVIDFGVAKAATNVERTKTGLIKGKPAYLSPEQIEGLELDGRSDIFALGIIFWEMLTLRRLFAGKDDLVTLRRILLEEIVPPSTINPALPPIVDEVVMKALAKNRDERYANGKELQKAIRGIQESMAFEAVLPGDLSQWIHSLFKEELARESERLGVVHSEINRLGLQSPTEANDANDASKSLEIVFGAAQLHMVSSKSEEVKKKKPPSSKSAKVELELPARRMEAPLEVDTPLRKYHGRERPKMTSKPKSRLSSLIFLLGLSVLGWWLWDTYGQSLALFD